MNKKYSVGALGEDIVCRFLRQKNYIIQDKNYLKPWGEIDIVAIKDNTIHFFEVKAVSRESRSGIRPEENLHREKIKRVMRAVQSYLVEKKTQERNWQIDAALVSLDLASKKAEIEVLEHIGF